VSGTCKRRFEGHISRFEQRQKALNSRNKEYVDEQQTLGQLNDYLEKIINSIATPVLVKDKFHRWILLNDACCTFIGHSRDELKGKTDHDYFPKEQADVFWETDTQVLLTKQENINEEELTDLNGVVHTLLTKKNLYVDPAGEPFIVVVITDITDRKKYEEALTASHQQLRQLSAHTEAIVEAERTRIAREVHDELGQSLTALKMDCAWLERRFTEQQSELRARTQMMAQLIDDTITTVRRISTELRPEMLDDLGLPATLEWQLQEFQKRTSIDYTVSIKPKDIKVSETISTAVYRVFQETLTNVARHAQATAIEVLLTTDVEMLRLRVHDNGIGITDEQRVRSTSLGLLGIRERVDFLGGVTDIFGAPGGGTTVEIKIPLTHSHLGGSQ
jgi:two-component system, NarL family, sensor histidine kinase UhpB